MKIMQTKLYIDWRFNLVKKKKNIEVESLD
jgi:hypothetical protein